MNNRKSYLLVGVAVWLLVSCAGKATRKTADYYNSNRADIERVLQLYDQLYKQQPFSAGFSDKSFRYYLLEVSTDSVRYIYNTEQNREHFYATITRFQYDTAQLKELGDKLQAIKCLWLSKSSFFVDEARETVTFLSFKSVASSKPFVENKYYILIFLKKPINNPDINARVKKGDLIKINDLVYYMIGSGFR